MRLVAVIFMAVLMLAALNAAQAEDFPAKGSVDTAQQRTININGVSRDYLIQPVKEGGGPFPVVVLLHGGTQTARQVWEQTSLPVLAAREHFILVAPQGVNNQWNDVYGPSMSGQSSDADDLEFLHSLIRAVIAKDKAYAGAVFLAGVSKGGFMALHYACAHAADLRAVASVAASLPLNEARDCRPTLSRPLLLMNGMKDPFVPFEGQRAGTIKNGYPQPPLLSPDETFAFWTHIGQCKKDIVKETLKGNSDNDWAERRTRKGCIGNFSYVQYVFHNVGHQWPDGGVSRIIDSGSAIWDFFHSTLPEAYRTPVPPKVGKP